MIGGGEGGGICLGEVVVEPVQDVLGQGNRIHEDERGHRLGGQGVDAGAETAGDREQNGLGAGGSRGAAKEGRGVGEVGGLAYFGFCQKIGKAQGRQCGGLEGRNPGLGKAQATADGGEGIGRTQAGLGFIFGGDKAGFGWETSIVD